VATFSYLTVQLKGVKPAQDFVVRQVKRIKDISPAMQRVVSDYYRIQREWFQSEGGGRWLPLNRRYAAWKGKYFPGKPILRLTDKLYNEVTGRNRHHQIRRSGLQVFILGVPYWIEHEEGRPSMNLPQREVISPWIAQRVDTWGEMVTQHLTIDFRSGPIR
jgi:hypothetical protein